MIHLTIINHPDDLVAVMPKGKYVLEVSDHPEQERKELCLYHPASNRISEIGVNADISSYVDIQNAVWGSEDIFYTDLVKVGSDRYRIDLYKFITKTRTSDIFYSFITEGRPDHDRQQFKIFILSDTCILVQKESVDDTKTERRMGHIRFEQRIVDLESKEETEIRDENLNNNGLNKIIAISPLQIVTKTGYSYLEDSRFASRSETDALIESVFIHTTSRFIADLSIGAETIDAQLLASTYYSQYILTPEFGGDYLHFLIVDPEQESSVSFFYNVITSEQLTCKNEVQDMADLKISYVLADNPYVKNSAMPETRFLNLTTMEFDLSAMGEEFVDIIGELFIVKIKDRKGEPVIKFYHYPDMKLLHKEKGSFIKGCRREDDYFIYVHKEQGSDRPKGAVI